MSANVLVQSPPNQRNRVDSLEPVSVAAIELKDLPLSQLMASATNPRQHFPEAELQDLAQSIREQGVIEPLLVRPAAGADCGLYEIVAGERRFRAARLAGLTHVPCVVRQLSDRDAQLVQLAENLQRADLSAIEEAKAFRRLTSPPDEGGAGLTQKELAELLGISQGQVANRIRLLELPEVWQSRVISREIPPSHARTIVPYAAAPAVLATIERKIESLQGVPPMRRWQQLVADAVYSATAPLVKQVHTADWREFGQVRISASEARAAGLNVIELERRGRKEKRALNKNAAYRLLREKALAWRSKHSADAKGKKGQKDSRAAEESARRQSRLLHDLWDRWLVNLCAERVRALDVIGLLRVIAGMQGRWEMRWPHHGPRVDLWCGAEADLLAQVRDAIATSLREMEFVGDDSTLAGLCTLCGVDPAAAFAALGPEGQAMLADHTEEFFEILTDVQVEQLRIEWCLPEVPADADAREFLMEQASKAGRARPLPLPTILEFCWTERSND